MHYAVSHGNFDVVSVLLDSRVCDAQRQNAAGYTCIMLLSLAQIHSETHRQVVRRLFQSGDVNVRAKQVGNNRVARVVWAARASPPIEKRGSVSLQPPNDGKRYTLKPKLLKIWALCYQAQQLSRLP